MKKPKNEGDFQPVKKKRKNKANISKRASDKPYSVLDIKKKTQFKKKMNLARQRQSRNCLSFVFLEFTSKCLFFF
jgi:hypothetical protein